MEGKLSDDDLFRWCYYDSDAEDNTDDWSNVHGASGEEPDPYGFADSVNNLVHNFVAYYQDLGNGKKVKENQVVRITTEDKGDKDVGNGTLGTDTINDDTAEKRDNEETMGTGIDDDEKTLVQISSIKVEDMSDSHQEEPTNEDIGPDTNLLRRKSARLSKVETINYGAWFWLPSSSFDFSFIKRAVNETIGKNKAGDASVLFENMGQGIPSTPTNANTEIVYTDEDLKDRNGILEKVAMFGNGETVLNHQSGGEEGVGADAN